MNDKKYKWTFMVYMAGDNGKVIEGIELMAPMDQAGYRDIEEMRLVGSTEEVAILAQFDTLESEKASYRLHVQPADQSQEWSEIPEQNTGDPISLSDFVVWGMEQYPADNYAVVLWNHGTGWKEDDIYEFARGRNVKVAAPQDEVRSAMKRRTVRHGKSRMGGGLFMSAAAQIVSLEDDQTRGICYDDSSMDFLDNAELKQAFEQVGARTGKTVSLIGMDACLMTMLEVAYQVRGCAQVLVGSQEVEPMAGWPYTDILRTLTEKPTMSAQELAEQIVHAYGEWYGVPDSSESGITQSAIDLSRVEGLLVPLKQVANHLIEALNAGDIYAERAIFRAGRNVQRFFDRDYVDLHELLVLLRDLYTGEDKDLGDALDQAIAVLEDMGQSPVLANVTSSDMDRASGLSIYLPGYGCSPFYDKLDFATSDWNKLLQKIDVL